MENLVEKLKQILSDFSQIENPTQEQINKAKQDEFNLFGEIGTIRELCEYYKTDMEIDKMPKEFISGMYSGVVNGSMFVINEMLKILEKNETDGMKLTDELVNRLYEINGMQFFVKK